SEPYIPWLNGAIKRLIEEETFERDDDSVRQNAIEYFDELMSSWQIRPNLEIPQGLINVNGSYIPSTGFVQGDNGDAASEPQQRISTGYSASISGLGNGVNFAAWDTRSNLPSAVNLFNIQI